MLIRPSASSRLIVRSERTTDGLLRNAIPFGRLSVLTPVDRNDRRRRRRRASRRRYLIRRAAALAILVAIGGGFAYGAHSLTGGRGAKAVTAARVTKAKVAAKRSRRALPREMRGVHVTMTLASLHG